MKCKFCKKDFTRSKNDIKRGRTQFCSLDCHNKNQQEQSAQRVEKILATKSKQCNFCYQTFPLQNFFKSSKSKDGFGAYCKKCKVLKNSKSWKANKHKHLDARKNSHLIRTYSISLKEYKAMLNKQDGLCAICFGKNKDKRKLSVDHCHKTGKIRGLLCTKCNQAIGLFNDDPAILVRARKYLGVQLVE